MIRRTGTYHELPVLSGVRLQSLEEMEHDERWRARSLQGPIRDL